MDTRVLGRTLDDALAQEWLVTDGLGGYASGTVAGPNTRRYHGLLVAPLAPPLGRHVLLSKLEEKLRVQERTFSLGANEFDGGTIEPQGFQHLASFELREGVPVWRYAAGDAQLVRRVWMERGQRTTFVSYSLEGQHGAHLSLTPLCEFRDFHHETVGSEDWHFQVEPSERGLTIRAYAGATPYHLLVHTSNGTPWTWSGHPGWWWHFLHRVERERGQDCLTDCYAAGSIECALEPGETLIIAATVEQPATVEMPPTSGTGEDAASDLLLAHLRRAAGQFLVARTIPGEGPVRGPDGVPEARTVLAGYHWFGDWGRDTFIALPGLAMATGRFHEAREIVRAFARYVDKGMLPNRFPETGAPLNDGDYNTVDATLWYFHAVDVLDRATGGGLAAELFPVLADIITWHVQGTRFGIRMDPTDGLVRVDNGQLTWMDAKVGDWVVTPRDGKPVEIAALWHHALGLMATWAGQLGRDDAATYEDLRRRAAEGFKTRFWYAAGGYLYDTVDGSAGDDASLRPNQAIAAALPDTPLMPAHRKSVVDVVTKHLWTPRGLRTLSPEDPRYRGHYGGDVWQRDGAYHQGTVWPWPLGSLVDAHLLVYGDPVAARRLIEPLGDHVLSEAGIGSISEIFDGDTPHAPRGCIAQAWSVSEIYRAWLATATSNKP
jgi:predicted glycogen debranching enzyme